MVKDFALSRSLSFRFIFIFLYACFAVPPSLHAAIGAPVQIWMNGERLDETALVENGRTLLPLEAVSKAFHADYQLQQDERGNPRSITIVRDGQDPIEMTVGSEQVRVGNQIVTLDVAPQVYEQRIYVPTRFVAESLGLRIDWDPATRNVTIQKNQESSVTTFLLAGAGCILVLTVLFVYMRKRRKVVYVSRSGAGDLYVPVRPKKKEEEHS